MLGLRSDSDTAVKHLVCRDNSKTYKFAEKLTGTY
jgi:hypothetical protein